MAVKVFRLDITPEQSAALARELEQLIARDIGHRGVAVPIAAGTHGHNAYLAMEYVVGDSLDVSSRDGGPRALADVARIVDVVASAIDACAARGVHHGLLHPRDVIIGTDGPRVTGFGIGEALTHIGLRLPVRRPYAAPEGASDVYSLAAIAYELISGRRMTPTGWDELSAEDGPELRDAFASALSPDPQARPSTAGEFAAMLRSSGAAVQTRPTFIGLPPPLPVAPLAPVEPAFDVDAIDPFADGASSDLHLDFVAPPKALQPEELEDVPEANRRFLILLLVALVVAAVAGFTAYGLRARRSTPAPVAQATPVTSPAAATTVDLPPAPVAVPPEPALPAPTPSRPASGAATAPPIRAAANGRLLIRSTPAGASVIINGEPRGKTPLTVRDLALGSYTIHLTRNGFAAAERRVRLTARRPSESMEISLKAASATSSTLSGAASAAAASGAGRLMVESRPSGARVFVNDKLVGSTPLATAALPAGPATVRIEMDGYQPWVTTIRVAAGEQTRVAASLDRK